MAREVSVEKYAKPFVDNHKMVTNLVLLVFNTGFVNLIVDDM